MSRTIKFRVWDKILGRYIPYGPFIAFDNPEYVFEQFTGLKDSKGKDIYEGDIIDSEQSWGMKGVVVFDEGVFSFDNEGELYYLNQICERNAKIIGNTLENPELIKKCNG